MDETPAFPTHPSLAHPGGIWGMTLRDYFAAKVIQGMLATDTSDAERWIDRPFHELAAKLAYAMADAMLKARDA